jgi:tRNA (mo5U34)-methyltransferase
VEAPIGREHLSREIASRQWYHTIELAPGVETPGYFDLRGIVARMPLPDSLAGKRCLDIGTFDGFWAFEMERRGAREVVAIDVNDPAGWDWPAGATTDVVAAIAERKGAGDGFEIARRALGSGVERIELSVYDLDPDRHGRFDFVYLGSLLLHLRDPVGALERVRSVCAGTAVVCDAVDPGLSRLFRRLPVATLEGLGRPWWWKANVAGLVRLVEAGGFEVTRPAVRLRLPPGKGHPPARLRPQVLVYRMGREETMRRLRGDSHAALVARPSP